MKYTENNGLIIKEKSDNYGFENFNKSMNIIDDGLSKFYTAVLSNSNTYKIITGLNKQSLNNGYSIRVAIPSNSTGAVSIIVDSVMVSVKKPNGNPIKNFKAGGIYSLTYYNGNFICASGADESDSTSVGTDGSNVLAPTTFIGTDGEAHTGTMKNNGAVTASLNCGGKYVIPKGFHNGSGYVQSNSLASQTNANATEIDMLKDKTAWVNGKLVTGALQIKDMDFKTTYNIYSGGSSIGNSAFKINEDLPTDTFNYSLMFVSGSMDCTKDTHGSISFSTLCSGTSFSYTIPNYSNRHINITISDNKITITGGTYLYLNINIQLNCYKTLRTIQ